MKKDRELILDLIEEKIFNNRFPKTSINYIASTIKMSKKTIYKNFKSKDELLESLINRFTLQISNEMESIIKKNINAVEKIALTIYLLKKISEKLCDKMIEEIHIHHPALWQKIEKFRTDVYYKNLLKIFAQGIDEGYVIEIPPLIIMNVFQSAVQSIIDPSFIISHSFSLTDAFKFTHKLLLNGILTEKGRKELEKLIRKNKMDFKLNS
ncbi:TetR/AcrR family transcriptional regulator [Melioribacteraceae bacterium 4301-Me]|uniref:TetR/AcrR family transcriptional regulator n=1 Tax=Pyranulibacter aquaticus TaxID=3163344 RepID=UPI003597215A